VCFLLCKYFVKNTPFCDIQLLIKEIYKVLSIYTNVLLIKKLLFFCSNKIFFLNSLFMCQKQLTYIDLKNLSLIKKKYTLEKIGVVIFYNLSYVNKLASFFKDLKILSIGFIDFHNQPNLTDYTIFLEVKSFSSLFFISFYIKKKYYYMLKIKVENIYMSKLAVKFINTFIFMNLKLKMENLIYLSFFY